jgi:putative oxidoreductase
MIRLAAMAELAGAVLLLTGFLTIYGAALAATTLLVAGLSQCLKAGAVMAARGGGEYPLALAAVSAAIGLTGAGAYSLDATLGTPLNPGLTWWTVVVCVVAPVLASIPPTLRARVLIARGRKDPSAAR